jgi:hypothetical protein
LGLLPCNTWAASITQAPTRLGLVLAVVATAQLMVSLDLTIVNVALPHIQAALGFSGDSLEWAANAYAVTFGGLLLLGGPSDDLPGRRRIFIAGLLDPLNGLPWARPPQRSMCRSSCRRRASNTAAISHRARPSSGQFSLAVAG